MKEDELPTIAHVMRGYLAPTETFIGNQISTVKKFRTAVLCHHQVSGHSYPRRDVVSVVDVLPPGPRVLDALVYRAARVLISAAAKAMARQAVELSASLIHFHYLVDARFFLPFKRSMMLPALVSAYGYDVSSFPRKYWGYGKRYLRALFDEMDLFIAMSQDMKRDMLNLGCPEEKAVVHYHGIDTRRFVYPERTYSNKDEVNILVCGTLEVKKAQHLVLEALRLVEQRKMAKRRFHVRIVGDGPMHSHLEDQVAEYAWGHVVTFTGFIPHHTDRLINEYHRADIFSLPSITIKGDKEGIPGTIVEAMAAGLPVVSTYHAGIPEIIESGRHGILVKEKDIEAMARAFADLIDNVELRGQLGRAAARRAVDELDLRVRTKNLERIYASLLNGTG